MCGLRNTFGRCRISLSRGIGSGSKTSSAKRTSPFLARAISASGSTIAPRETLTKTPPGRSSSSSRRPIMRRVFGVNDAHAACGAGRHVDPVGEAVALELADQPQLRRPLEDAPFDQRRAVADEERVEGADLLAQPLGVGRVVGRPAPDTRLCALALGGQPL